MFTQQTVVIKGREIRYHKVNNDINGNPRYVIHFLALDKDYETALSIVRKIGGKVYKAKWFGGGFVFQSYSFEDDLSTIVTPEAVDSNTIGTQTIKSLIECPHCKKEQIHTINFTDDMETIREQTKCVSCDKVLYLRTYVTIDVWVTKKELKR